MSLTLEAELVPLQVDRDGVARVGDTRVTLDTVVAAFLEGATPEEIAQQYPHVKLGDLYAVIAYYLHHIDQVNAYLDRRRLQADAVRRENEARFDPSKVRDRLLARRPERG